jgi:hypothetical protein
VQGGELDLLFGAAVPHRVIQVTTPTLIMYGGVSFASWSGSHLRDTVAHAVMVALTVRSVSLARFEATSGLDVIVSVQNSNLLAHYSSAKNTPLVCEDASGIGCYASLEQALRSTPVGTFVSEVIVRGRVRVKHLVLSSVLMQRPVIIRGEVSGSGSGSTRAQLYCDGGSGVEGAAVPATAAVEVCGKQQLTLRHIDIAGCPVTFLRAVSARVVMRDVVVTGATSSPLAAVVDVGNSTFVVDKSSFSNMSLAGDAGDHSRKAGAVLALDSTVFVANTRFENVSSPHGSGAALAVSSSIS